MEQSNYATGVLDFSSYVTERTQNFIGRESVLAEIDRWIAAPDGSRFFIVTGEPGSGKSSLAGRLCQFSHGTALPPTGLSNLTTGFLSAFHFCGNRASLWLDPLTFTHSIAVQLDKCYSTYKQALIGTNNQGISIEGHAYAEVLQPNAVLAGVYIKNLVLSTPNAQEAFNRSVLEPLQRIYNQGFDEPSIILVDGLDISLISSETKITTIGELLFNLEGLPSQVRFIVTTRPVTDILRSLQHSSVQYSLSSGSGLAASLTDIKSYVLQMIKANASLLTAELSAETFGTIAQNKSEGNFLYVRHLLQMLNSQKEQITSEMIDQFPTGLIGIYRESLERLVKRDWHVWEEHYAPVLGALTAAQEGLSEAQLASFTGKELTRVRRTLQALRQLLDTDDALPASARTYTMYHQSFIDFLFDSDCAEEFWYEPKAQHKRLADWCERGNLATIWQDVEDDLAEQGRQEYARQHYIVHLFLGQDWNKLFKVIDEGKYGQSKLHYDLSTYLYARDLDLAREATTRKGLSRTETLALLSKLWRYSLLRCSLTSGVESFPPQTYLALVLLDRGDEAIGLAELITSPGRQAAVLANIASVLIQQPDETTQALATQLLSKAYDAARDIPDASTRLQTLSELLNTSEFMWEVARFKDKEVAARAIQLAQSSTNGSEYVSALGSVIRYLSRIGYSAEVEELLSEVLHLVGTFVDAAEAEGGWFEASSLYADIGQFNKAREAAENIKQAGQKLSVLTHLAAAQQQAGFEQEAKETLIQAHAIVDQAATYHFKVHALEVIARAEANVGNKHQASRLLKEALDILHQQGLCTVDTRSLIAIARSLRYLGDDRLALTTLAEAKECMVRSILARKPTYGQGYTMDIATTQAAQDIAELDQWEMALEVASVLLPYECINVLEAVVESLVRNANWDKAVEIVDDIAQAQRETHITLSIARSGILTDADAESRSLCIIINGLAQRQEWSRALAITDRLSDAEARCYALGTLALEQVQAGQTALASEAIAQQMSYARLWNTRIGKDTALSRAVGLLVRAGDWAEAMQVAEQIETPFERTDALVSIAEGLIEAAELKTAQVVIEKIESPDAQGRTVVTLARKLAALGEVQGALDVLSRARQHATEVDDDQIQSNVLRNIGLALADLKEVQQAEQVIFEAMRALQRVKSFRWRPTPWCDICGDLAKIGSWDMAVDLAHRFSEEEVFDRATALRNLARVAWESDRVEQALGLLSEAQALVPGISFSPLRADFQVSLAEEFARMGQFDRALGIEVEIAIPDYKAKAIDRVAEQFAQAGKLDDALALLKQIGGSDEPTRSLSTIVKGFLLHGDWHKALEVTHSVKNPQEQASALAEIASQIFDLGLHEDAHRLFLQEYDLAHKLPDPNGSLEDVTARLARAGEYTAVMDIVQQEWLRAATRQKLLDLLPMVNALVVLMPQLGREIYASFGWIEEFLQDL